ncbi:MAG TPA: sulfur oxidation c-type cytochrome SoxA [Burkholderiales bacterium]|nr:sulfur oxidation c-type cytochrome SoxA [Burkholderiales bacterium]
MDTLRSGAAAFALACLLTALAAAQSPSGLEVGRKMLMEDNPGELWIDRGKKLFHEKRGPRKASLEQCDFGLGPGKLKGATTHLPRYFADTDKVEDLDSRIVTCMVTLQGFKLEDVKRTAIGRPLTDGSDVEAIAMYVASNSNGMKMDVRLDHPKEREMYKAGQYLFFRRSGQTDFGCVTCHGDPDKRIRLQDLVHMLDKKEIQAVAGSWPAYRGAHGIARTMQWRLYDCFWQMRLPELGYLSDVSIALSTYLNYQGNGGVVKVPGFKR